MQESETEQGAIRVGYEYAQILGQGVAERFPNGSEVDVREEIQWQTEQIADDPKERADLLPYVAYGFRQGTLDLLYQGDHRYVIKK